MKGQLLIGVGDLHPRPCARHSRGVVVLQAADLGASPIRRASSHALRSINRDSLVFGGRPPVDLTPVCS
jgi:hypothetical protein